MENTGHKLPDFLAPALGGCKKSLKISWLMAKIIVPVTFVLIILEKTGWLETVAGAFAPLLGIFGLSGEAALPLFLGFFVNIYAAMGAIAVLTLSPREITVIALIILTCHSLLMEAPVLKYAGLSPLVSLPLRFTVAMFFGLILNAFYLLFGG